MTSTSDEQDRTANSSTGTQARARDKISTKLYYRITQLSSAASKESIQTIAKWIFFHISNHPVAIQQTLVKLLTTPTSDVHGTSSTIASTATATATATPSKSHHNHYLLVTWNILHELCISGSSLPSSTATATTTTSTTSSDLWLQRKDIRESLGESVIRPGMEFLYHCLKTKTKSDDSATAAAAATTRTTTTTTTSSSSSFRETILQIREKVKTMLVIWQELDSFESPTLLAEMKRLVLKMGQLDGDVSGNNRSGVKDDGDAADDDEEMNVTGRDDREGVIENVYSSLKKNVQEGQTSVVPENEPGMMSFDVDQGGVDEEMMEDEKLSDVDVDVDVEMDLNEKPMSKNNQKENDNIQSNSQNIQETNDTDMDHGDAKRDTTVQQGQEMIHGQQEDKEEEEEEDKIHTKDTTTTTSTIESFEFEKEGIPQERVPVHDLLRACRAVATLQITRDMRNDSSHNLTSILSRVPQNVLDECSLLKSGKQSEEKGGEEEGIEKMFDLNSIPDDVLDLDIARSLANVKLHREIIQRQREFKKECIEMLIKSRCNFGSMEAASLFYELDGIREKLNKRKALVLDAMELEGIESEAMEEGSSHKASEGDEDGNYGGEDDDPNEDDESVINTSFAWFSREDANAKKQKIFLME
mmetsp:Transcript_3173/g.5913  ORF Transcript_3173/g.5913 Transcript_3173/m.5913 type:complete len:644 (+) Transcript_3173:163-2094(+)